jgi:heterodisulfide reductase subunit C
MSTSVLNYEAAASKPLLDEVTKRSGQNLQACYQCRRCAAGCPVGEETGVTPDRLIRLIVVGDREGALNNLLVWKCVACYTCGTRCPNNIQTARITETLKQMSKEAHLVPLMPRIADFHKAFMTSTSHLGRFNEIESMAIYETKTLFKELAKGNLKAVFEEMKGRSSSAQK